MRCGSQDIQGTCAHAYGLAQKKEKRLKNIGKQHHTHALVKPLGVNWVYPEYEVRSTIHQCECKRFYIKTRPNQLICLFCNSHQYAKC